MRQSQGEILPIDRFGGHEMRWKARTETGEKLAQMQNVDEETLRNMQGVGRRDGNEDIAARPNRLREKDETGFQMGNPNPPERIKRCISSRTKEELDAKNCSFGKAAEIRTQKVKEYKLHKEKRDVLEETMTPKEREMSIVLYERNIALLGDRRRGHRRQNRKGISRGRGSRVMPKNIVLEASARVLQVVQLEVEPILRF